MAYAAMLSDMRMPGMDGATFLGKARELAQATPRRLLARHYDQEDVCRTISEGRTFRILTKPCSSGALCEALKEAVREYEAALLGRRPAAMNQVEAVETVSPAALAIASAIESIFAPLLLDAGDR